MRQANNLKVTGKITSEILARSVLQRTNRVLVRTDAARGADEARGAGVLLSFAGHNFNREIRLASDLPPRRLPLRQPVSQYV